MLGRTLLLIVAGVVGGFLLGKYLPRLPAADDMAPPPAAAIPGVELGPGHVRLTDARIDSVLDLYEQVSGRHLIRDTNFYGLPGAFNLNGDGLSREDLLTLIRRTLLMNGVALVPVDDHTEKAMTTGTNKNPRSEGPRVYTNPDDLPAGGQIVTYSMPLSHIDPTEAEGIFTLNSPVHTYGSYTPAPSAHAIILTEDVDVVRQLIKLQKVIDVEKSPKPSQQPPDFAPGLPWREMAILAALVLVATIVGNILAYAWFRPRGTITKP